MVIPNSWRVLTLINKINVYKYWYDYSGVFYYRVLCSFFSACFLFCILLRYLFAMRLVFFWVSCAALAISAKLMAPIMNPQVLLFTLPVSIVFIIAATAAMLAPVVAKIDAYLANFA